MASDRKRGDHTLEDVERERQAEMNADREYTTPERARAIEAKPDEGGPPGPEDDWSSATGTDRHAPPSPSPGRKERDPEEEESLERQSEREDAPRRRE
jgi:hypothetical protein